MTSKAWCLLVVKLFMVIVAFSADEGVQAQASSGTSHVLNKPVVVDREEELASVVQTWETQPKLEEIASTSKPKQSVFPDQSTTNPKPSQMPKPLHDNSSLTLSSHNSNRSKPLSNLPQSPNELVSGTSTTPIPLVKSDDPKTSSQATELLDMFRQSLTMQINPNLTPAETQPQLSAKPSPNINSTIIDLEEIKDPITNMESPTPQIDGPQPQPAPRAPPSSAMGESFEISRGIKNISSVGDVEFVSTIKHDGIKEVKPQGGSKNVTSGKNATIASVRPPYSVGDDEDVLILDELVGVIGEVDIAQFSGSLLPGESEKEVESAIEIPVVVPLGQNIRDTRSTNETLPGFVSSQNILPVGASPSGMPIRELQLQELDVTAVTFGIAQELDQFEAQLISADDMHSKNYDLFVDPVAMNYKCQIIEGSMDADIMMRDYNSMFFQGLGVGLVVDTVQGCCDACRRTQGCNAWTYCNNPQGCGYGCDQVIHQFPRVTLVDYLPVLGFGKFSGCGTGSRYPYHMCTLKSTDDWHSSQVVNGSVEEGWLSGYQEDPALVCGWNMSLTVCNSCVNSVDPYACTWCGNWEHLGPDEKAYCSLCANASKTNQTSECLGCLGYYGTQRGCGSCVRSHNLGQCLACASLNMNSENHQRWCFECSISDHIEECMDCIQEPYLSYPYKQLCKLCARMDVASPSRCMQCLRSAMDINHAQLCTKCAILGEVDDSICFNCLSVVNDPNMRHTCLECNKVPSPFYCQLCLQNEDIPVWSKDLCPVCTGSSLNSDRCMNCLSNSTALTSTECMKCVASKEEGMCLTCIENVPDDDSKMFCHPCVESEDPIQCMSCIEDSSLPMHAKRFCPNCMRLGGNHSVACIDCLRASEDSSQASACGTCANLSDDVNCFNCVEDYATKLEKRFLMSQCANCYASWVTEECLNCLSRAENQHQLNVCRKCASNSRPKSCFACLDDVGNEDDNRETCLTCIESDRADLCPWCIKQQDNLFVKQMCQFCLNTQDPEGCVECLNDPKVPQYAKYHCHLCQQSYHTGGVSREWCEECIRGLDPYEGYFCWNCCQTCGEQPICSEHMTFSAQSGVLPNPNYLVYDYE